MSKAKTPTPRQQHLMQKYRMGVQYLLPGEKIISEFEPKSKNPTYLGFYSLGLAVSTLFAILPMILNLFSPTPYWYVFIIIGAICEHIVLSFKDKIPEVSEYVIYLTDIRIISQKVTRTGKVLLEKEISRKKLKEFHIRELGLTDDVRKNSHLIFFYCLILFILPFEFLEVILGWADSGNYGFIVVVGMYEAIMFVLWLQYFKTDKKLQVNRDFILKANADQVNIPLFSKISRIFSGPALNNYGWLFGNITNRVQKTPAAQIKLQSDGFIAKNSLDFDSKEFFDITKNHSKELLQTPLLNLMKGTAIDIGFLFAVIVTILLHQSNMNQYSLYGMYLFYGILGLMILKFFFFIGSMIKFSLRMLTDDPTTLLGNLSVIRPGYQSFTTSVRFLGLGIALFYYTGNQNDYIPIAIAISLYLIVSYIIGGIFFMIVKLILKFPIKDENSAAYFSGNEILVRKFEEKSLPKNVNGQLVMLNKYENVVSLYYNTNLTETKMAIEGNFNRDFSKIIEFEYKIYYLLFLSMVFSLGFLFPQLFDSWAPGFATWSNLARDSILIALGTQSQFSFFALVGMIILLSQVILVFYFSKILQHFVELREPNIGFQFDRNYLLYMKAKSVQDGIDISWNVRDIIASGKEEYTKRAESFYKSLNKKNSVQKTPVQANSNQTPAKTSSTPSIQSTQSTAPTKTKQNTPVASTTTPVQIGNVAGQRPTPLRISQIQRGTTATPLSPNAAFSSPYPIEQSQAPSSPVQTQTNTPNKDESVEMTAMISSQTGKQDELKASTEFIQVDRNTPYTTQLDLSKPANFYLFQIDSKLKDIESQIAWESEDPISELDRFASLSSDQKDNLIIYLKNQPFEVQQRVIHVLHYVFLANFLAKK